MEVLRLSKCHSCQGQFVRWQRAFFLFREASELQGMPAVGGRGIAALRLRPLRGLRSARMVVGRWRWVSADSRQDKSFDNQLPAVAGISWTYAFPASLTPTAFHSRGDCPECALNARESAASLP